MKRDALTERVMTLFDQMTEEQKDEMITQAQKILDARKGATSEPKEALANE